jgi:aromatic-amino-acid transaminase
MLSETQAKAKGLADLPPVTSDSLLALIALANADPRPDKIDVGVGVFRDAAGETPILKVMKKAERILLETQSTKAYLGSAGDKRFAELIRPILLGEHADDERIAGVQTPGGCGALRLGFELIATANPDARVFVTTPTWPNHRPLIRGTRLAIVEHPYYDRDSGSVRFEEMLAGLGSAREDSAGLRGLLAACDDVIVAQSCDKNFSVYRDRVGSLFLKTGSAATTATAMAHVFQRAREMWSMPPDHGAAAVRIILDDPELRAQWHVELDAMRDRINGVRQRIAAADPRLAFIGKQFGMFSMLPLSLEQVLALREKEAIYMADSGRFNVVGMADRSIDRFVAAVVAALDG